MAASNVLVFILYYAYMRRIHFFGVMCACRGEREVRVVAGRAINEGLRKACSLYLPISCFYFSGQKSVPKLYAVACNPTHPYQVVVGVNTGIALLVFDKQPPPPAVALPAPPLPLVGSSRGTPSSAAYAFQMGEHLVQVRRGFTFRWSPLKFTT